MEFPVYVFLVAVVVAVSLCISIRGIRRRKAYTAGLKHYQDIVADARDTNNIAAQDELLKVWQEDGYKLDYVYPSIKQELYELYQTIKTERAIRTQYRLYLNLPDIDLRLDCLVMIIKYYDDASRKVAQNVCSRVDVSPEQAKQLLLEILQPYVDSLAIQAKTDRDAFTKMTVIRSETFEMSYGRYWSVRNSLEFPPNWNDLVAQHISNPNVHDFVSIPRGMRPGDVRIMALSAVEDADLTRVKFALALINHYPEALNEVGHGLANRLARFVITSEKTHNDSTAPNQD